MADKLPVLLPEFVQDTTALRSWTAAGLMDRRITRRQFSAIELTARKHLPCQVVLLQRTSKSVLYLHINDRLEYRIGPRAELYGSQPQEID